MQLESQCVRIQLQEYRGSKFIKGTSRQFRVYNVTVDELMRLVRQSVEKESAPEKAKKPELKPTPPPLVAITPTAHYKPRKPLSDETKANISAAQAKRWASIPKENRFLSKEAKEKISIGQAKRWARVHNQNPENDNIPTEVFSPPPEKPLNFAEIKTQPLTRDMYLGV